MSFLALQFGLSFLTCSDVQRLLTLDQHVECSFVFSLGCLFTDNLYCCFFSNQICKGKLLDV